MPVGKIEWNGVDEMGPAGGEDTGFVYSGTLVVQGSGTFKVALTGASTVMGHIGSSLNKTVRPPSSLQLETRRVVGLVAFASLGLSIVIAGVYWFQRLDFLQSLLMGLTFAMSTIPEEFPVVLTIFMALGAWRISKQKVLTRQMNAIEALGSATCLCVDKTGTLTENRMSVAALWTQAMGVVKLEGRSAPLADDGLAIIRTAAFASDPAGFDPMDKASIAIANESERDLFKSATLTKSFPLVRPLLAVGHVWNKSSEKGTIVAAKGAPESILKICRMDPSS